MWTSFSEAILLCARVLYLAFPVIFAAAVHLAVIRYKLFTPLAVPMDFGRSFRGRRVFGDHKTWRGAFVMVAGSSVGMALQSYVRAPGLEFFDYGRVNVWLYGALLGLGFVLAELPNSFLKRRWGVPPGRQAEGVKYWVFTLLDQVDSVLGCLLALALVWPPPWAVVVTALGLCSMVHVAFNLVFVWLGLKVRAL
jgi:hypothetical protein